MNGVYFDLSAVALASSWARNDWRLSGWITLVPSAYLVSWGCAPLEAQTMLAWVRVTTAVAAGGQIAFQGWLWL